jgi:outer membrane protein OmpA-like peptidoglycan-associated protein
MQGRAVIIPIAAVALLGAGCATKKFVREEVGKTEAKLGGDVGRVEGALSEERTRITTLTGELGQTRTAADEAGRRATEAAGMAKTAQDRAEEVGGKAAQAQATADEAKGAAGQALTKAEETDARLTRLWSNRHKRTAGDTITVLFGFDRADLDDRGQTALLEVARQLQENPALTVELEGYTDNSGAAPYNVQLSERRAESVRRFLVEKGVELHRIHHIGLGDLRPIAQNTTRKGREQNRRVMVRMLTPTE